MIAQVDEALCRLLRPCLPAGTQIRLDPPKPTWQTESQVRSVELFLFALHNAVEDKATHREGTGRRDAGAARTGVTRLSRRCTLSYLVTARAERVREEHLLLDAALHAVAAAEQLPAKWLPSDVEESSLPVRLEIADTDPTGLWTSLGMPARAGFVVSVTAGLDPKAGRVKPAKTTTAKRVAKAKPAEVTKIF